MAGHGAAGPGEARPGKARRGMAWLGGTSFYKGFFRGQAGRGTAGPGLARLGKAWRNIFNERIGGMSITRYPLDFDALKKGDYIPPERIEEIFQIKLEDDIKAFHLKLLGLKEQIEDRLWARGETATIKIEKDGVRILLDSEAADYNEESFNQALRKAGKAHHRNLHVNVGLLEDEKQLKQHERTLEVQGLVLQAISETHKKLRLHAAKRTTPGLPA